MTALIVHPQKTPLVGSVPLPSDESIAHRALVLGALCNGKSRIRSWGAGERAERTRAALEAMGIEIVADGADRVVTGAGLFGLRAPSRELDCEKSGASLLCGVLAAQPFASAIAGDAPRSRVIDALRARGARIEAGGAVRIAGLADGEHLGEIQRELSDPRADEKSALLLSGLYAHGSTTLREDALTPDHTERMLLALGVPLRTLGTMIELDPAGWSGSMPAFDVRIPSDLSAAAFLIAAAAIVAGSRVTLRAVGTNPTRAGLLDALRDMQAPLAIEPHGEESGEPFGDIHVESGVLVAAAMAGERVTRGMGEIPALCAIAARARGMTKIRDAGDEPQITTMVATLRAFGVACDPAPGGLDIEGTFALLEGARIDSRGDPRVALSAATLALVASAPSRIEDVDCLRETFPRFVGTLRALGARIDVA
ncbi:MAG TPA: 3-phosphoshikimate 1-carboxyvinyltransferase [Polyangiaceae bacterium]